MSTKKPQVIPTKPQDEKKIEYEKAKLAETINIFNNAEIPVGHSDAMELMKQRTLDQLKQREEGGQVVDESLRVTSEKSRYMPITSYGEITDTNKQINSRDEQLLEYKRQTEKYQRIVEETTNRNNIDKNNFNKPKMEEKQTFNPTKPSYQPKIAESNDDKFNRYVNELSQPDFNSSFDVIPLPSKGKLYPNKKANIRMAYMTTADENILTSPNLLQSGKFLEILINRKILEPDLRYADLHVGDRNAIMLWLRATSYGEMYPVTFFDEDNEPFDSEVDLNELKMIPLGAEPDAEGLFKFQFPLSKVNIKFKLLTCGDLDEIEALVAEDTANNIPLNRTATYILERIIVEVDGERHQSYINEFVNSIRIFDASSLTKYVESIESGVDLNINITTPRGGSVSTFLPLNVKFFWPNFKL